MACSRSAISGNMFKEGLFVSDLDFTIQCSFFLVGACLSDLQNTVFNQLYNGPLYMCVII
jgi:hypothetical protein